MSFCTFLKMAYCTGTGADTTGLEVSATGGQAGVDEFLEDGFSAREFRLHGLTHAIEHRRATP